MEDLHGPARDADRDALGGCAPTRGRWGTSVWLGLALVAIYLANGRMIGAGDTEPARMIPLAVVRGDGAYLDRFADSVKIAGKLPYYLTESRGHVVSKYPIAPALLAAPLSCPQIVALDLIHPSWERENRDANLALIAKNTQAVLAALIGVALFHVLRTMGLEKVALPATLIAALGSNLWAVASQAPWQHGPAALALVAVIGLLSPTQPSRRRFLLAGLAAGLLTAFRPIDVVFSATIFFWVLWHNRARLLWFLPFPVLVATALLAYNFWCFGDIRGGYSDLQSDAGYSFSECWGTSLAEGGVGTLLSPNRGLFVFTPWIGLALLTLPLIAGRLRPYSLVCWLLGALVPYFVLLAKYRWWSAGWSFGPRYWTDVIPLFAIMLAFGLDWARQRSRPALAAFAVSAALGVIVQVLGVFTYPSSWNAWPESSDEHPERIWSWRDTELGRGLAEGIHPATYRPWSRWAYPSAIGLPRSPDDKPRALGLKWWAGESKGKVRR